MELCRITGDFPGGNIKVVSMRGHEIGVDVEMRDSTGDWFYWCFKAHFREPGQYHFEFPRPGKVGTRGPAISLDGGINWRWLSAGRRDDSQGFDYFCPKAGEEVLFCTGIQYLQRDLEAFLEEFSGTPFLQKAVLCRSRKGRNVELLSVVEGHPKYMVLLTSRHHSVEMMATHVLEGILRATLEDSDFGRNFRRSIALFAIPFVDPDYVIIGEGNTYNYENILKAVRLVLKGAKLIGTNSDLTGPAEDGIIPACRAMIAPIEMATGQNAYFVGKPNPLMMRTGLRILGVHSEEAAMIGDRMDTDMVAGIESGLDTVLVLSGITSRADIKKFPYRPRLVLNGVGDIPGVTE